MPLINERIEMFLGKIVKIVNRQAFPLAAHINTSFSDIRTVYVGDAAHSIHPIAGQGWNLGMRDVYDLTNVINEAQTLGIDLGSSFVSRKYQQKRFLDTYSLYNITDKLNSIFMSEKILPARIRRLGFGIINNYNFIKKNITNYAMGNRL